MHMPLFNYILVPCLKVIYIIFYDHFFFFLHKRQLEIVNQSDGWHFIMSDHRDPYFLFHISFIQNVPVMILSSFIHLNFPFVISKLFICCGKSSSNWAIFDHVYPFFISFLSLLAHTCNLFMSQILGKDWIILNFTISK